jgi:hypothetical protein
MWLRAAAVAGCVCAAADARGDLYGSAAVLAEFRSAFVQRIALMGAGDSNQIFQGFGNEAGFVESAWAEGIGVYATPTLTPASFPPGGIQSTNRVWMTGQRWSNPGPLPPALWRFSGATGAPRQAAFFPDQPGPANWTHNREVGVPTASLWGNDGANAIRSHLVAGVFPGLGPDAPVNDSEMRPHIKHIGSPDVIADGGVVSTLDPDADAFSTRTITLDLQVPFDDAPPGEGVGLTVGSNALNSGGGPHAILHMRAEAPWIEAGISYTTGWFRGGEPYSRWADDLAGDSLGVIAADMEEMLRLSDSSNLIYILNETSHDWDESPTMSIGPNPADVSTLAGIKDTRYFIMDRLTRAWETIDGAGTLYFLAVGKHPGFAAEDATEKLTHYELIRQAWREMVFEDAPDGLLVDPERLLFVDTDELPMLEGFEDNPAFADTGVFPDAHLSESGYLAFNGAVVSELLQSRRRAVDLDGDGVVSVDDLYTLARNPRDLNGDGRIDLSDYESLERFLRRGARGRRER